MIDFNSSKKKRSTEVNLTPMIDIIFNLLIFFLITAVISQKGLNLKLPESFTAEKRPKKSLEITVTKEEAILFDGKEVSGSDVEKVLREERDKPVSQKVDSIVLKSDAKAPFGIFVSIMDTARKLGLKNLVIATEMPKEKEDE